MKSDIIKIDNHGKGYHDAVAETRKVARYAGMNKQDSLQLQLLTEEMLSMVRIVTGEVNASYWIEVEDDTFVMHMNTKALLDAEKRAELIEASSSRKNEAAKSFLGMLRDSFERAMASDVDAQVYDLTKEEMDDLAGRDFQEGDWDGYERSVLHKLADDVKIGIKGQDVSMTVTKSFKK